MPEHGHVISLGSNRNTSKPLYARAVRRRDPTAGLVSAGPVPVYEGGIMLNPLAGTGRSRWRTQADKSRDTLPSVAERRRTPATECYAVGPGRPNAEAADALLTKTPGRVQVTAVDALNSKIINLDFGPSNSIT